MGSGLLILKGKPEVEIQKIVEEYKVHKIFAEREVAWEEKRTEKLVQTELSNCVAN
jgi:deoxyribodipyrimidine photo-lyase